MLHSEKTGHKYATRYNQNSVRYWKGSLRVDARASSFLLLKRRKRKAIGDKIKYIDHESDGRNIVEFRRGRSNTFHQWPVCNVLMLT